MQSHQSKPIFVVGSPRSGTSILTWCLGHHPNIFPVPESNWMGDFAVNVAIAHQIGSARGEYSVFSAMDVRDDEFFAAFGRSINDLIMGHRKDLEIKRETKCIELKLDRRWLEASSTAAGPKTRWVDGTPEYSFHICGLRKLFPEALFVHMVRDVQAVVRSMVNFHRVAGFQLVASEEDAYRYWIRTVSACLIAERAYGPTVVHRIRYADLIDEPESMMRSLLDFIGEPYTDKCLEPLAERINSSSVPPDFGSEDATINPAIIEEAHRLSTEIDQGVPSGAGSSAAVDELETAFRERVKYVAALDDVYQEARRVIETLPKSGPPLYPATEPVISTADPSATALSQQPVADQTSRDRKESTSRLRQPTRPPFQAS